MSISSRGINEESLPAFLSDGWMKAASAGSKLVVKTVKRDGVIVGRLSYIKGKAHEGGRLFRRFRVKGNPHWLPYSGIVLDRTLSDPDKREVARILVARLSKLSCFKFQMPCHTPDAHIIKEAFAEAGFEISGNKTRLLRPEHPGIFVPAPKASQQDIPALLRTLLESATNRDSKLDILAILDPAVPPKNAKATGAARRQVRGAAKDLEVISISPEKFAEIYADNLKSEGKASREPLSVLPKVIAYGVETGNVRIFAARQKKTSGESGEQPIDAAIACAWDNDRYYLWRMTVRKFMEDQSEEQKPHPNASRLLIVHAMIDARLKGHVFDTEGGVPGHMNVLFPRMGLTETEDRIVAYRAGPIILAAEFTKRAVKTGMSALRNIPKRSSQPAPKPSFK